jgi:hypothetical protein
MSDKKCIHKCQWKKTGSERYSFPSFSGQYEQKCVACGKTRWKEYKETIKKRVMTEEESAALLEKWWADKNREK